MRDQPSDTWAKKKVYRESILIRSPKSKRQIIEKHKAMYRRMYAHDELVTYIDAAPDRIESQCYSGVVKMPPNLQGEVKYITIINLAKIMGSYTFPIYYWGRSGTLPYPIFELLRGEKGSRRGSHVYLMQEAIILLECIKKRKEKYTNLYYSCEEATLARGMIHLIRKQVEQNLLNGLPYNEGIA